jgi:alcohol dehydrogenase class IV
MTADLIQYDFLSPQRIVFGWGRRREVGTLARTLGQRVFVVPGSRTLETNGTIGELVEHLKASGLQVEPVGGISREPDTTDVDRAVAQLREFHAGSGDLVLAIGGGSALDLGKAAAALSVQEGTAGVHDYLEGVGRGLKLVAPPLPIMALPTTGGTGTEATKNAVISSPAGSSEAPFKKSLRSDLMVPKVVLVDPELSVSVPPATTAWTGMDAITQCIESYISRRAKPIPRALALAGLMQGLPAIVEAVQNGSSRPAREGMAQAALLSGMALANSGLGLAHGVAAALGVHAHVPHGLACAVMLPVALRVNRQTSEHDLATLARVYSSHHGSDKAFADLDRAASDSQWAATFIEKIDQLCQAVGVPRRLSELGIEREQLPKIVRGSRGNSMDGNPCEVSDAELQRLLEEML